MCTDEQDSDRGEHGGDHAAAVEQELPAAIEQQRCPAYQGDTR